MRSSLIRTLVVCTIAAVALFGVVIGVNGFHVLTPHAQKAHADAPLTPVGKWHLTVVFTQTGARQPSDIQFVADGGNVANIYGGQVINYTPGPGTGYWSLAGQNQFMYQFMETIYSYGIPVVKIYVSQTATLSADGNSYVAHGQGTAFSPSIPYAVTDQTTTYGTRA